MFMTDAKTSCPKCGGHIAYPKEMAGKEVSCPHCGEPMLLPKAKRVSVWIVASAIVAVVAFAAAGPIGTALGEMSSGVDQMSASAEDALKKIEDSSKRAFDSMEKLNKAMHPVETPAEKLKREEKEAEEDIKNQADRRRAIAKAQEEVEMKRAETPAVSVTDISDTPAFEVLNVTAKPTEQNEVWWRYGYRLTVRNNFLNTDGQRFEIQFLDAEGYVIDTTTTDRTAIKLGATEIITGAKLVMLPGAARVAKLKAILTR